MRFSELAEISVDEADDWFDPVLTEDTPLYVDPFLVFEDVGSHFGDARADVVQFFGMCRDLMRLANGRRKSPHRAKALRLLEFKEPKEFALGLAMGTPVGSGTSQHYAVQMAESLEIISRVVDRGLDYVDLFALFVPGLGVDRISDIFCNILKARFIAYTQEVCKRHGVATEFLTVKNSSWSSQQKRWMSSRLALPRSPVTGGAILLCPNRFLQDIPQQVTPDGFWGWAENNINSVLRDDLNYDLAVELTKAEKAERGRSLARQRPDDAFRYVDEVAEQDRKAYDAVNDPDLLVRWFEAGRAAGREEAANAAPVGQPSTQAEFCPWVDTLIARFTHAVEHTDLWRALWDDGLTRHRKERIVQAVAGQLWVVLCETANVDVSREVNVGRGPVDFKFSAGWERRALLELKLLSSTKLQQGAEAQLPQYLKSERISCGYYVCVGFTDAHFEPDRLRRVQETCAAYQEQAGYTITPRFIDARPKASASRIT